MRVYLAGPPGEWREWVTDELEEHGAIVDSFKELDNDVDADTAVMWSLKTVKNADLVLLNVKTGFNQPGSAIKIRKAFEHDIPVIGAVRPESRTSFITAHLTYQSKTLHGAVCEVKQRLLGYQR